MSLESEARILKINSRDAAAFRRRATELFSQCHNKEEMYSLLRVLERRIFDWRIELNNDSRGPMADRLASYVTGAFDMATLLCSV